MSRQTNKQNSFLLSSDGEWHTVGPVVVGRYTQTGQRWLRAKIAKSGHDRDYKKALAMYRNNNNNNNNNKHHNIENLKARK